MAGHSKWANIQHRKQAQDAKRGKLFTKFIREITVAARRGGADIATNPRLRLAVEKALAANMSRDTIERAIKRGAGGLDSTAIEELIYEGYGPAGVAVMVECLTDNRNRTVAEVRHAFSRSGGNLGNAGSVAYLFAKKGLIHYAKASHEEQIMGIAIEAGADDIVTQSDQSMDVLTTVENFAAIKESLMQAGLTPETADVTMIATTEVALDQENAEKVWHLIEALEDLDDVQNVYTNANVSDEIMEKLK